MYCFQKNKQRKKKAKLLGLLLWCSGLNHYLKCWWLIQVSVWVIATPLVIQFSSNDLRKQHRIAQVFRSLQPHGKPRWTLWLLHLAWFAIASTVAGIWGLIFLSHGPFLPLYNSIFQIKIRNTSLKIVWGKITHWISLLILSFASICSEKNLLTVDCRSGVFINNEAKQRKYE